MKIRIRYDDQVTLLDIPEEDCTVMIQTDYEERCSGASDPSSVQRRSAQEIIEDRFNRSDYNNWHRHWRHADYAPRSACFETTELQECPDTAGQLALEQRESYMETCALLRRVLKPDYADMVIAIHLEGLSLIEYAAMIGDKPNNVSHRLKRAEKKLRESIHKEGFQL